MNNTTKEKTTIITVSVEILLPINILMPEEFEHATIVEICSNPNLNISLVQRSSSSDFIRDLSNDFLQTIRNSKDQVEVRRAKKLLSKVSRTFISPEIHLDFYNFKVGQSELPDSVDKNVVIEGSTVYQSSWYLLANRIHSIYNTIVEAVFRVFRKPEILSKRMPSLSLSDLGVQSFPKCLELWATSVRIDGETITGISFELTSQDPNAMYWSGVSQIQFNQDNYNVFRKLLKDANIVGPKWHLAWQYILLSESHNQMDNLRIAIIDLDIASNVIMREWLRSKVTIADDTFEKLISQKSTGELIDISEFFCNREESKLVGHLSNLHNIRNTILHRYQRNLKKGSRKIYERAQQAVITLLENVENQTGPTSEN